MKTDPEKIHEAGIKDTRSSPVCMHLYMCVKILTADDVNPPKFVTPVLYTRAHAYPAVRGPPRASVRAPPATGSS